MGKKPFGKRLLRLDKAERASISGGSKDPENVPKPKKASGAKKINRQNDDGGFSNSAAQLHAIKRMIQTGMSGPRRLGPYSNSQRILLVGEGDFSFALALASILGGSNIVCTSLDKLSQLQVKYGNKVCATLASLEGLGAEIHHQVDATKLQDYLFMTTASGAPRTFDRIVFNFPDVGDVNGADADPAQNAALAAAFLASAAPALSPAGAEIHLALCLGQDEALALPAAAAAAGLRRAAAVDFHARQFAGYRPQQTFPGPKGLPFACAKLHAFRRARPDEPAAPAAAVDAEAGAEEAGGGPAAAEVDPERAAAAKRKMLRQLRRREMVEEDREWQDALFRAQPPAAAAAAAAGGKSKGGAGGKQRGGGGGGGGGGGSGGMPGAAASRAHAAAAFLLGR